MKIQNHDARRKAWLEQQRQAWLKVCEDLRHEDECAGCGQLYDTRRGCGWCKRQKEEGK